MKALVIVIIAVVFIGSGLALWACCAMASKCSREEEKAEEAKRRIEAGESSSE